jgi:hypothetical protein
MMINSLDQAEKIVEDNNSLQWNGWNIVYSKKSPTAWMKPEGLYKDGDWYSTKFFNLSEKGWEIPDKFVR